MVVSNTYPHVLCAATIADLLGITVAPFDDGVRVWVTETQKNYYLSRSSSLPINNVDVLQPVAQALSGAESAKWLSQDVAGGGTELLEGVTLAQLAAISGSDAASVVYVFDTAAIYRWAPASVATPDGWTVVSAPGGRWIVQGDRIALQPLGGVLDDWERLFGAAGAATAAAAMGIRVVLGPGTWRCDTVQQLSRGLVLDALPGASIVSTLTPTPGGGHLRSVFSYDRIGELPAGGTELAETATAGSTLVEFVGLAGVATVADLVGQEVLITAIDPNFMNQGQAFVIEAASGTGPYAILLDRPVLFAFPAGSGVRRGLRAKNIHLHGHGAPISGTGDRAITLVSAWGSHADDWNIDGSQFSEYNCSFDTGSYASGYERIHVENGHVTALALEACENCWQADCTVESNAPVGPDPGIIIQAAYNTQIRNARASGCTTGMHIGYYIDTVGSHGITIEGGSFNGNGIGVDVRGGTQDVDLYGVDVSFNTSHGVRVLAETAPTRVPGRVRLHGGRLRFNGGAGLLVDGGLACRMEDVYTEENGIGASFVTNGGSLESNGCHHLESNTNPPQSVYQVTAVGSVLRVENCRIQSTNTGFPNVFVLSGGELSLRGIECDMVASSGSIVTQFSGQLAFEDVRNVGASIVNGIVSVGGTTRRGPLANLSNTSTPFTFAGGQPSFGQIVLNGAGTAQTFPFTDAKASDLVADAGRKVLGGAAGFYTTTVNPGVGVVIQGVAGDTSTVEFFVY
jgi:hypothetical protein